MMKTRFICVIFLIGIVALFSGCSQDNTTGSSIRVPPNGETKIVQLYVDDNYEYSPQEIRVKAGTTLRIEADPATNIGGMDTVVIEDFYIRKRITADDNVIEFIADTPGTFDVLCANGMGNGRLIVE